MFEALMMTGVVAGGRGRAMIVSMPVMLMRPKLGERLRGKSAGTDLERERPFARRHEARRDERTKHHPHQHEAGDELAGALAGKADYHDRERALFSREV